MRARLSSAGRALPSLDIQIRDDDGSLLPAGSVGRIWVRGEQVSGEYADRGPTLDAEGFFDTRDQGYLDEGGYLFVRGRTNDTIIRGGENIAPAEIEDVLLMHAAVDDAAVVGLPDPEWGQRLEAVVVAKPGCTIDPEALRGFVRERLRSAKTPDHITVAPELPRTEAGKLTRRNLIAQLRLGEGSNSVLQALAAATSGLVGQQPFTI